MIYLAIFLITLFYVFLRAFQQKNVQHSKYMWMIPISYCMGFCDVYLIATIANMPTDYLLLAAAAMGTGGSIGSMTATYIHNRWNDA